MSPRSIFHIARRLRVSISLLLAVVALALALQASPTAHAASHATAAGHVMTVSFVKDSPPAHAASHATEATQTGQASPTVAAAGGDVSIVDFAFDPSTITITAGSSVRWTRSVATSITHTTTSDVGSLDPWNSGQLAPGESFTKTFNTPGTYTYHCEFHPFTMLGTVVVLAAGPEPPAAVSIAGPFEGAIDTAYTFTATVSPLTATLPITYSWQATGQSPITHTGGDLSDTVMFTWTSGTTGTQLITTTATNEGGTAIGTHIIIFNAVRVYLPLVLR